MAPSPVIRLVLFGSLLGCGAPAKEPGPRPSETSSSASQVSSAGPTAPRAETAEPEKDSCISAELWGPLDSCRELQLVIRDTCRQTKYTLDFSTCTLPDRMDLSRLDGFRKIEGAWVVDPAWANAEIEPKAIRGSLHRTRTNTRDVVRFDLQFDVRAGDVMKTRAVKGTAQTEEE